MFYILYAFCWIITLLPLWVLYLFSDCFYYILYYIIGYRKNVVKENLAKSFPDKTLTERRKIENNFYRFFCDLFVETLKEIHMSKAEMKRRMTFGNVENVLEHYANGKSVLLMTAHYGNWEWSSSFSLWLPNDKPLYGIYKQLTNNNFDLLMRSLRMKFGGKNAEKHDLLRIMLRLRSKGELAMFGMISDQTPNRKTIHYWSQFLNQETPTITGTEQLARKFDYPVYYGQITRIKRGYYHCELIPISLQPALTIENEITEKFVRMLEQTIVAQPAYWLWTHRRWKYSK